MLTIEADQIAVFSDAHGDPRIIEVFEREPIYKEPDLLIIGAGDHVDRSIGETGLGDDATYQYIQKFMELGSRAIGLQGNHDWSLTGALVYDLSSKNTQQVRNAFSKDWLSNPGSVRTLLDYGIMPDGHTSDIIDEFRAELGKVGHLDFFRQLMTALEAKSDFVVHAGLDPDQTINAQRSDLYANPFASAPSSKGFVEVPKQLCAGEWAASGQASDKWSKRVVTGHSHLNLTAGQRMTPGRVRLATDDRDTLFVYHSWTNDGQGEVVAYDLREFTPRLAA